ncbi:hypothetical protein Tco_0263121, partial [Tanacetum coccineum]
MSIVTTIQKAKAKEAQIAEEEPTRAVPILTVRPLTRPDLQLEMISSLSIIRLTDTILELPVHKPRAQATGLVINITSPEQPKSPPVAPSADRGKRIAIDDVETLIKLVKASSKVRHDPDEPVTVPYEILGKLYHLTNDEIQEHLDKDEKMKKDDEEAKLLAMSKPELIKVIHEEASKANIDPKILENAKGGQEFKKI